MGANSRPERICFKTVELQVLHILLGFRHCFIDWMGHRWDVVHDICSIFRNNHHPGIMVTVKIGKHTVEMYDAIDELPIVRFHKYQKLLLIDAGIGSDIAAFDQRLEKTRRYLMDGKPDQAQKELENLRQMVYLIQNGINPQHRAFAVLVSKLDGQDCNDLSDDALTKVLELLKDAPVNELTAQLEAVKKKIDGELSLYFPGMFADSQVKEYYDLLRKRTLTILQNIIDGLDVPDGTPEIEKLNTALITYSNPKIFSGPESVEIQFDRQFENLCLVLSEQLHVRPKGYTVLEFYNAFAFVQQRAKEAEKARKRR